MLSDLMKKAQDGDIHTLFLQQLLSSKLDKKKLEKLASDPKFDINHLNNENENFLFICLELGEIKSALWLLTQDINVTSVSNNRKTPFDLAIENLNHRVVRAILNKHPKINLDKKDNFGRTKLQDSVVLGNHEMAKILIEHGADINSTDTKGRNVLYDAFSYGNMQFIEYLLTFKNLDLNNIDIEGNGILHHKLALENNELAKKLIEHGANPNLRNAKGDTYLSVIAQQGVEAFEMIEVAISNGFDINSRVADEKTILMEVLAALSNIDPENEALRKSLLSLSTKLIKAGLDINAIDKNKENVLFQAVKNGDTSFVLMLLKEGVQVNIQNINGESPLFYACYGGEKNIEIISYLFKYNANPLLINKEKKTILEILNDLILSYHGKKEFIDNSIMRYAVGGKKFMNVLKVVLKHTKEQVNFLDSHGKPVFFPPLLYNHIGLFKLYVRAGADLDMLSLEGKNIFFEYVLKVFEDEDENVDFEDGLSILISKKVDHNIQDETGWTVFSKVIAQTSCNLTLFKALLKRVKFDLSIVDKLGRTVLHSAIWKGNMDVVRIINKLDKNLRNVPDHYGILPIIYSALIGNKELILYFVKMKAKLGTKKPISQAAVKKFSPLLSNIEKLRTEVKEAHEIEILTRVAKQLKEDFVIDTNEG